MTRMVLLPPLAACAGEPVAIGPECSSCHGSETNAAPPAALGGIDDPTYIGVGAHQAHVDAALSNPIGCDECHPSVDAATHVLHQDDGPWPAAVQWGPIAGCTEASPWDRDAATCSVWCHTAGPAGGGTLPAPSWIAQSGEASSCGACHGLPPPDPHPQVAACEQCHSLVVGEGSIMVDVSLHANGIVDLFGAGMVGEGFAPIQGFFDAHCTMCHSGAEPPQGLDLSVGRALIVDVPSVEAPALDRVEPGDPERSYLWHKINGTQESVGGSGTPMPMASGCIDADTLATIEAWILDGAQE